MKSNHIGLAVAVALLCSVACGGAQGTDPAAPITYGDMTMGEIIMTKPIGKHVRTSGFWMGPQAALQAPEGYFGSMIMEGTSSLMLYVPKKLAGEAAKIPAVTDPSTAEKIVIEGKVEKERGMPVLVVHRFGN